MDALLGADAANGRCLRRNVFGGRRHGGRSFHPTWSTRGQQVTIDGLFRIMWANEVPLLFTLSQINRWPINHPGDTGIKVTQEHGHMQVGMAADITIFDPENVTDNATYKQGELDKPTTGIPYVIVSSRVLVRDSQFLEGI